MLSDPTDLTDLASAVVLAVIGYRLARGARIALGRSGRTTTVAIVRGVRLRHLWPIPLVFAGVVAVAVAALTIPPLRWGWWSALGGVGNPALGVSSATGGGVLATAIPIAFIAMLLPAIPLFALREEEIFRRGSETQRWPTRLRRAIVFGLAHALIGIPIGVALALTVGGLYFTAVYRKAFRRTGDGRAALVESARAHTAYNVTIVALVLVGFLLPS